MSRYILSIDQSTQATKAMLFDENGRLTARSDRPHRQIINDKGWVEHDPEEIAASVYLAAKECIALSGIDKNEIVSLAVSNQRETAVCWNRKTGRPVYNAIVWQCARGEAICQRLAEKGYADKVREKTGIPLSPYFTAAKLAWIMENVPGVKEKAQNGEICVGTIDSWLVYTLTTGERHQTDYSNASRTQLFNITDLKWDEELLDLFGIDPSCMPQLTDSDGDFGMTDLSGLLDQPIPIHGVLGDSHGALLGQGCLQEGMAKATYGTGSSVMMNIGHAPFFSDQGVVTSLAWKIGGQVSYVLEGNINYTGAVITWLKDDVRLIDSPKETEALARQASPGDRTYLVPAFSGLGAPYWDADARAALTGMSRTTGRNEIVRAALDCIALQITDIVKAMNASGSGSVKELRADGGASSNGYLMQLQSDLLEIPVRVPQIEELSGFGAAFAAGLGLGMYDMKLFERFASAVYTPKMDPAAVQEKYEGWLDAVRRVR